MEIVYAAEKTSIAKLLGEHARRRITPDEILIAENPDETGSFCIAWKMRAFVLSPNGNIAPEDD
jgi:hypothetical protein